ncbi:MAG: hypothetical protein ACJ735_03545 [Actinomycetes bacterium]
MTRGISAVVGLAALLAISSCGGSSSGSKAKGQSASPTPAFQSLSAAEILAAAKADGEAKASVRDVAAGQLGPNALNGRLDVNREEGSQELHLGSNAMSEVFVDGIAYVKGDAVTLEQIVGLTSAQAKKYAGKWIAFHSQDEAYADAIDGMTLASDLDDSLDLTSAKKTDVTSVNGVTAIGVSGKDPSGEAETVLISVNAPHLLLTAHSSGDGFDVTETFSQWGQAVHVQAPAGAIRAPH